MNVNKLLLKCNTWQDFKSQLYTLSDKQKGDCFEELTKYFLRIHPTYRTQLRDVWTLKNVPPSVRKRLNLPGLDEGIDLIAETKDRTFWAIQCKYRDDESKSLTRKDLSTFTDLAFGISKNIELALVCTTADRFSHKLTLYGDRISFCSSEMWQSLDRDLFRQLHALIGRKAVIIKPVSPREHQKRAITNAYEHYVTKGNSRGKLIMPCGTGKSLTGYWLAEWLGAKTVLVAVPSLALIRQTLQVWARESVANGQDVSWIAVCSDDSVGDFEKDDFLMLTQDLGIRVHTNPNEISGWLKKHKKGRTVVFSTYQSGKAISAATKRAGIIFDLAILDEAHKTVGKKDGLFSYLLYDKNIRIKKRLFMTATERYYRGKSEEIASMDNPDVYGDTFEMLSFKSALEAKKPILSDYKIATILVSRNEITELINENKFVKPDRGRWDREVEAENLAALVALRKAMKTYPIRHAVSFHSSIARAKVFKENQDIFSRGFPEYGKLTTFHVSGKTPTAVRSREISEFASAKRSLITNARCLTEGVDVPNIDCVLFADPKNSTVDIVQAVGRALRPSPGKEYGYVIVPVLLDGELNKISETNAFSSILTVLRALAANDERIVEYFRSISQGKKRVAGANKFSINIPDGLVINAQEFINSIELKFWSRLAKLSWRPFEEAREFVRGLGLANVNEWKSFFKGELLDKGVLPEDISTNPNRQYEGKGWVNFSDWLGTGRIANQHKIFLPFTQARDYARNLGLKNEGQWRKYAKGLHEAKGVKPENIPYDPKAVYIGKGWQGWGDWLGTGSIASYNRNYLPFSEARKIIHSIKLKNTSEWRQYSKGLLTGKKCLPQNIPANPNTVYKDKGWINFGDWLGSESIATFKRTYIDFVDARRIVRQLKLTGKAQWYNYCQGRLIEKGIKPKSIPSNPNNVYKNNGWQGWGDWLGTGSIAVRNRKFLSFQEARKFSRALSLKNYLQWRSYCKGEMPERQMLPMNLPSNPNRTYYKSGWKGWGDWLGTDRIANQIKQYRVFGEARAFVHELMLENQNQWRNYCKGTHSGNRKPDDIPANPNVVYKNNGWISFGDWLGTGRIASRLYRYRSFEAARVFVRGLKLSGQKDWFKYCKGHYPEKDVKPLDIPIAPARAFKEKGWNGWADWLGTGSGKKSKLNLLSRSRYDRA